MKNILYSAFLISSIISSCALAEDFERGVVPTLRLIHDKWSGVDLSNYFHLGKKDPEFLDDSLFSFRISNDSLWIKPSDQLMGYAPARILIKGNDVTLMTRTENNYYHNFQYIDDTRLAKEVFVMGNFNNWSRSSHPLSPKHLSFDWQRTDRFPAGKYEYKFIVDGREVLDPANPNKIPNGLGGFNSTFEFGGGFSEEPCLQKHSWVKPEGELLFTGCGFETHDGKPLEYKVLFDNQILGDSLYGYKQIDSLRQKFFFVKLGDLTDGLLRIYISGEMFYLENHTIIKNGIPLHPEDNPSDPHFRVIYSLMVDRFLNGNKTNDRRVNDPMVPPLANYMGGDIAGITQKINEDYFTNLGINTLWISPITQGPDTSYTESVPPHRRYSGYHGYWPVESRKIDTRLGTAEDLKMLINTAHDKNISVLLDFVSNHIHENNPYYQNHRDWFGKVELKDGSLNIRNWSEETMLTTWFETFLPSFNFVSSPTAVQQVVDDAVYWIDEYEFDGFRQDATKHVPHSFWKSLRNTLNDKYPGKELFQIGETFGNDELISSFVNPGELDSQFNFSLYYLLRNQLINEEIDFNIIHEGIRNNLLHYQPVNLMGNITSSHDQVRFISLADFQIDLSENSTERAFHHPPGEVKNPHSYAKLFMFTAMNIALPGVPVIYYGEEIGMMGAGDPDNRRMMRFEESLTEKERSFLMRMKKLISLRVQYPSLSLGDWSVFYNRQVVGWKKSYFDEEVIFLFNRTSTSLKKSLPFYKNGKLTSLLDDKAAVVTDGMVQLQLAPYETKIYLVE